MIAGTAVWASGVLVGRGVFVGSGVSVGVAVKVGTRVGVLVAVGTAVWVGTRVAVAVAVGKVIVGVIVGVAGNGRVPPHPINNSKINSPHRFNMVIV